MEFPQLLSDQLAELSAALAEPGTDLEAILAVLVDDLTTAIPSFLGLTITVHVPGHPVTLATIDPDDTAAAGTSMSMPLSNPSGEPDTVVFYARQPGAFLDLAIDTRRVLNLDGQIILDGHLHAPAPSPGIGIGDTSVIDRALGVLIAHGNSPGRAAAELARRAHRAGHPLLRAAQDVLDSTAPPPA